MIISDDSGGPYFNAVALASAFDGRWIKTPGDPVSITATGKLALNGGGNISGDLFVDFTADPQEAEGIARLTLPSGCLHTTYGTITIATQKVTLASALNGSEFGVTLSYPVAGSMRFRWNPTNTSGLVAGANTLKLFVQMGRE